MVDVKPGAAGSNGEGLYRQYCAACHGVDRQGAPAQNVPELVTVLERMSKDEIVARIRDGKGVMPAFAYLTDEDRQKLAGFLLGEQPAKQEAEDLDKPVGTPYTHTGYNRFLDPDGYPAVKPPWGTLTAIDLNKGAIDWQVPLGEHPELTKRGLPPTGTENYGGPVVTAGGLIFIGATNATRSSGPSTRPRARCCGRRRCRRAAMRRRRSMRSGGSSTSSSPAAAARWGRSRGTRTWRSRCRTDGRRQRSGRRGTQDAGGRPETEATEVTERTERRRNTRPARAREPPRKPATHDGAKRQGNGNDRDTEERRQAAWTEAEGTARSAEDDRHPVGHLADEASLRRCPRSESRMRSKAKLARYRSPWRRTRTARAETGMRWSSRPRIRS